MKKLFSLLAAVFLAFSLSTALASTAAPDSVLPVQPRTIDLFNPGAGSTVTEPEVPQNVNLIEVGPARVMSFIFSIFTLVSIVVAIYAGVLIIFSGGDQKKVEKGVNALVYAAIGMLIVGGAWLFVRIILNIDLTAPIW